MAIEAAAEKSRLTVSERERTLVQQARRVEKAQARKDRARLDYAAACDAVAAELDILGRMIGVPDGTDRA